MKALIGCAAAAGYASLEGSVLSTNVGMLKFIESLGFVPLPGSDPNHTVKVVLALNPKLIAA
jgi:hypothetical protein